MLRKQAESNLKTQPLYYPKTSFDWMMEEFRRGTLLRTAEGATILVECLHYWKIEAPAGLQLGRMVGGTPQRALPCLGCGVICSARTLTFRCTRPSRRSRS